jgi:hypothetical protein
MNLVRILSGSLISKACLLLWQTVAQVFPDPNNYFTFRASILKSMAYATVREPGLAGHYRWRGFEESAAPFLDRLLKCPPDWGSWVVGRLNYPVTND